MGEGEELAFRGDVPPVEAWKMLSDDPACFLLDVRTRPELSYVGLADLSSLSKQCWTVEWKHYPDMSVNPTFCPQVMQLIEENGATSVLFSCRSGSRSKDAALFLAEQERERVRHLALFNVATGFEGDLDSTGHRGKQNGWKASGLPWRQT